MRIRRFAKVLSLLSIALVCTGCWDSMEINNRSIILEFAVDKNDDYVYDQSKLIDDQGIYTMSYTIPDFGKLSGTQSLAKDMETTIEVQAPTIAASIDDLQIRSKNTISFSHVKSIMLGESLMKSPKLFEQTIDSLSRDMVITRNTPILAVNGPASLTTQIENTEQPILGLYIMDYFNNKERATNFFNKQLLGNFIKDMEQTGISTLPIFHVEHLETANANGEEQPTDGNKEADKEAGKEGSKDANKEEGKADKAQGDSADPMGNGEEEKQKQEQAQGGSENVGDTGLINISGGAVIKDYELVDYLTKEEVRSQLFVQGKIKNSPVVVIHNEAPLTYNIKEQKSKLKFQEVNGNLQCLLEIDVKGDISEYLADDNTRLVDEDTKEVERLIGGEIVAQIQKGIQKSKALNVDFMGFGLACYRKENKLWDQYGPQWEEGVFEQLPIAIGVNVDIESTGIQE